MKISELVFHLSNMQRLLGDVPIFFKFGRHVLPVGKPIRPNDGDRHIYLSVGEGP